MEERIQKIISACGVASRRQAEQMITDGRVTCNGKVCELGDRADIETDVILLDGRPLPSKASAVYIMLHKPRGYVTTLSDEKGRKNVSMLVKDCGVRVYPVGRLDMDSEGLLLLTNDGDFAQQLMHPSHEINKTYLVTVRGYNQDALEHLKEPIVLDGYQIRPPSVALQSTQSNGDAKILVTIHEGRNRQVRRMCAAAGLVVKRLVRVREGCVELGKLPSGKWRFLTHDEVERLRQG